MMANVAATLVNGNLTLTENGGASNITIGQPAANQIRLTPAAGTTINGQANAITITGVTGDLTGLTGSFVEVTFPGPDRLIRRLARVRVTAADADGVRARLEDAA